MFYVNFINMFTGFIKEMVVLLGTLIVLVLVFITVFLFIISFNCYKNEIMHTAKK